MTAAAALMPFRSRFLAMLVGWGMVGLVYTLSGQRGVETAYLLTPTAIDRWFRFDPSAIWVYASFFVFVPLGFLLAMPQRVRWLARAFVISALGAALVFWLFPTTMHFPAVSEAGLSAAALRLLMRYDALVNCLPSLHVTLTALVLAALWRQAQMWRNLLFTLWAGAIILSILQLYRHQFVDLLAGLALALLASLLAAALRRDPVTSVEPSP